MLMQSAFLTGNLEGLFQHTQLVVANNIKSYSFRPLLRSLSRTQRTKEELLSEDTRCAPGPSHPPNDACFSSRPGRTASASGCTPASDTQNHCIRFVRNNSIAELSTYFAFGFKPTFPSNWQSSTRNFDQHLSSSAARSCPSRARPLRG